MQFKLRATGLLLLTALACVAAMPAQAAAAEEPVYDRLVETLKKDWFSVGLLLQVVGEVRDQGAANNSGFSIANARVNLSGELDGGWGYFVQGNFIKDPALLDGKLYYRLTDGLTLDAGLFKAPFSAEFLTSAASIDFVNRSRAVTALVPGREIGMQLRGKAADGTLGYFVGMFNGNRFSETNNGNDNGRFLYVARGELRPSSLRDASAEGELTVGVHVATSRDSGTNLVGGQVAGFFGTRELAGIDARYTRGKLLVGVEGVWSELDADVGPDIQPHGGHLTVGYRVTPRQQLLLRWDRFSDDTPFDPPDQWILGYNFWPTAVSELQLNYIAPERGGFDAHELLINVQIAF